MALRRSALVSTAALALLLGSPAARANGRFPAANQLVVAPSDPNVLVLRTTFGVLVSRDRGGNWDWVCERAMGYGNVQDPAIGVTQSKAILLAAFEGLAVSPDNGCAWGFADAGPQFVDLAVRPNDPKSAVSIVSAYVSTDDAATNHFDDELFKSDDDGAHWARFGVKLDDTIIVETVDVAASDPHRVYVSGVRRVAGVASGVFLASTDDGAHFTEHVIPLTKDVEIAPFIAAVDPTDANRVYVRIKGTQGSRVLVTTDAGATFSPIFTGQGDVLGFALSPDGSKVYLGGTVDGLHVAQRADYAFAKVSSIQVQCLTTSGTTLYACSNETSHFVIGASDDDGKTFAPKLNLSCVRGPLACPPGTTAAECPADYPAVKDVLGTATCDGGLAVFSDAGAPDASPGPSDAGGNPGAPGTPAPSSGGCGCTTAPATGGLGALVAALAGAALTVRRRRRAR